jgi:hypothetical protein
MLAGLAPALEASRADVSSVLKAEGASLTMSVRGARLRATFLTVQIALALALLMVAGTFVRTLVTSYVGDDAARMEPLALAHVDLGTSPGAAPVATWTTAGEALSRVPGVRGVTLLRPDGLTQAALAAVDGVPIAGPPLPLQAIDAGYLRAADARVIHGREPEAALGNEASGAVLLNTVAARRIVRDGQAVAAAVGRTLTLNAGAVRVAGIVDDGFVDARAYRATAAPFTAAQATFLVRTDGPASAVLGRLRTALAGVLPVTTRPTVATYRDANMRGLGAITHVGALLGGLALLLAGAGVAGSMAFHGRQRAREIAVRRALGASTPAVLRLIGAQAGRISAIGIALGVGLGWLGTHAFLSLVGGPAWDIDWVATAGVAAVFAVTIALASFGPAWRAVRLEPSAVLHQD